MSDPLNRAKRNVRVGIEMEREEREREKEEEEEAATVPREGLGGLRGSEGLLRVEVDEDGDIALARGGGGRGGGRGGGGGRVYSGHGPVLGVIDELTD